MRQINDCYCELAPLYELGVLDGPTQQWVEAKIREIPELAPELEVLQQTMQALPYGAPVVPVAPRVKQHLFDQLGLELPIAPSVSFPSSGGGIHSTDSARPRWQPYKAPGIKIKILRYDPQTYEVVALVKARAGAIYPAHEHEGLEEIYMLEGDLTIANQVYHPGDYLRSEAGSVHPIGTTTAGCQFFLRTVQRV